MLSGNYFIIYTNITGRPRYKTDDRTCTQHTQSKLSLQGSVKYYVGDQLCRQAYVQTSFAFSANMYSRSDDKKYRLVFVSFSGHYRMFRALCYAAHSTVCR